MLLKIKNWDVYQHYKDRRPPWIKLHRTLLDDWNFAQLSGDAAKGLVFLWLIASEDDGYIKNDINSIAFRLRVNRETAETIIDECLTQNFLIEVQNKDNIEKWPSRHISEKLKADVMGRDGGKCQNCQSDKNIEIDHIIPVSKGGESVIDNLQLLCRSCNRQKRTRIIEPKTQPYLPTDPIPEKVMDLVNGKFKSKPAEPPDFAAFWSAYPNKKKKDDALKAWRSLIKSNELPALDILLASIDEHKKCDKDWTENFKGETFIPAAGPYLRGKRWQDEFQKRKASDGMKFVNV